jgi:hypothetical protein
MLGPLIFRRILSKLKIGKHRETFPDNRAEPEAGDVTR